MSRTLKDRPYWVQLNESKWYDHDHRHLGEEYWFSRYVYDENNNFIYDETEYGFSAGEIVASYKWMSTDDWAAYREDSALRQSRDMDHPHAASVTKSTYNKAKALTVAGKADTYMPCGTYMKKRRERYLAYTVADHCTEWEAKEGPQSSWRVYKGGIQMPCTPAWDGAFEHGWRRYTRDMSGKKHSYSRLHYSTERAAKRDGLRDQAKAWNTGWDVEDWDQEYDYTAQHHHSMNWDLW